MFLTLPYQISLDRLQHRVYAQASLSFFTSVRKRKRRVFAFLLRVRWVAAPPPVSSAFSVDNVPRFLIAGRKVPGMINGNTRMSTSKVAVTIDRRLLERLDALVKKKAFPNRSKAIQLAVQEQIARLDRSLLARECAKLDSKAEQAMAEEGLARDRDQWPEY